MANTGYQITPTLIQKFLDGPESGSIVTGSFGKYESQLGVAPFSASLDNKDYYQFLDKFDHIQKQHLAMIAL